MTVLQFLSVFIGCGIGGLLRFMASLALPVWGTFLVNCLGTCLLALSYTSFSQKINHELIRVGLLGGLTTYSTFVWESYILLQEGRITQSVAFFFGQITLSFLLLLFLYRQGF